MPALPQHDLQIRKLSPPAGAAQVEYRDTRVPGLSLIVGRRAKSWSLTYVNAAGQRRRTSLGRYPEVPLAEARKRAEDTRSEVRQRADPQAAKRAYKASRTVAEVAAEYVRLYAPQKATGWFDRLVIRQDVLPEIGSMKLVDVTRREIQAVLRRPLSRGSAVMANRTLEILRKMLSWAVEQGWAETNPAEGLKRPTREIPRGRALSDDELKAVWHGSERISEQGRAILRLLILTGQREMEVIGAAWSEFDLGRALWTLPAHVPGRSKRREAPHLVPLSRPVLDILVGLRERNSGPKLFAGNHRGHASRSIVEKGKRRLDAALPDIEPWRIHDLRRTVRTGLSAIGIAPHVAELVIGHAVGGLVKVYDRYDYLAEKRDALDRWARHVLRVVGEDGAPAIAQKAPAPTEVACLDTRERAAT